MSLGIQNTLLVLVFMSENRKQFHSLQEVKWCDFIQWNDRAIIWRRMMFWPHKTGICFWSCYSMVFIKKLVKISIINKIFIFCKIFDGNGYYFKIIWRLTIVLFSREWNLVANVDYFAFLGNLYLNKLYFYIMQFQHIMWPAK